MPQRNTHKAASEKCFNKRIVDAWIQYLYQNMIFSITVILSVCNKYITCEKKCFAFNRNFSFFIYYKHLIKQNKCNTRLQFYKEFVIEKLVGLLQLVDVKEIFSAR